MNIDIKDAGIFKAINNAMLDIDPIAKSRKNSQQGYNFRGIDDVYNDLNPILSKHGIFTASRIISDRTEERTTKAGSALIYRILHIEWKFYALDGSFITSETIGEGMDSGDKASNKAMAVAHKYALMQLFAIPTEDAKDPEIDSHELAHKQPKPTSIPEVERVFMKEIRACKTLDELEAYGTKIAERCPNKTAPESVKSEYRLRQRELTPELS